MVRRYPAHTNVTVRKGLVDVIEEEIVKPGYLGYTSDAEVIHDGGRLLIALVVALKLLSGEPIKSEKLAALLSALRKKGGEML